MREELDILRIVAENPSISQRKISEQTGISLGQVNFLIKKCVKKGLIKIEGQTPKSVKYNLTPKGISEKASKTLQYIKISFGAVISLSDKIRELADKYIKDGYTVYIYGSRDEMMEIIQLAIQDKQINIIETMDSLTKDQLCNRKSIVFYWEEDKLKEINDVFAINIIG